MLRPTASPTSTSMQATIVATVPVTLIISPASTATAVTPTITTVAAVTAVCDLAGPQEGTALVGTSNSSGETSGATLIPQPSASSVSTPTNHGLMVLGMGVGLGAVFILLAFSSVFFCYVRPRWSSRGQLHARHLFPKFEWRHIDSTSTGSRYSSNTDTALNSFPRPPGAQLDDTNNMFDQLPSQISNEQWCYDHRALHSQEQLQRRVTETQASIRSIEGQDISSPPTVELLRELERLRQQVRDLEEAQHTTDMDWMSALEPPPSYRADPT
jgi:hypothetical protein